jgi:dephospho-CoA kinase
LVATKSKLQLAGLTGTNASGKGEAARILEHHGYRYRSLSDVVRDEASRQGMPPSRENLIVLANQLRRQNGPGVMAARTVPMLSAGLYVVDSIRHPEEVNILKRADEFILIAIDAPIEIRFQRAQARGRDESSGTLEEFRKIENRERTEETNVQQLDATFRLADHVIVNDKSLSELEEELLRVLKLHKFPTQSKKLPTDVG